MFLNPQPLKGVKEEYDKILYTLHSSMEKSFI